MNTPLRSLSMLMATVILLSGCASTTLIQTTPAGADVYINNQKKGKTPYRYSDTKIVGSSTDISLKKEGYQDFNLTLVRNERADVGAIIGGCFVLFPFLWTMRYDADHQYELVSSTGQSPVTNTPATQSSGSVTELIKLQNLLDQKALTTDDFTTLKVRILNNDYQYNNSIADQINKLKGLLDSGLLTKDEYTSEKKKLVNRN